jgi:cell division protein FtsQ
VKILLLRIGVGVGAVAVAALVIWLVWFSQVFSVQRVSVIGADGQAAETLAQVANVPLGTPLALVNADAIAQRAGALPWVAQIEVRRGWPDAIVLAVTERTGIARQEAQLVDAEGVVFTPIGPIPKGLPTVRASGAALQTAMQVYTTLPEPLANRVVRITARTRDDVTLTLRSGAIVRWGSPENMALKAAVLETLMNRRARIYDVSAPELPTTYGERR